jgi:pantetheine-phosphate adenylyltransferase
MTRIAVYPGSFDPVTRGHEDLIRRTLRFADRVIVAVADNASKTPLFTLEERLKLLRKVLAGDHRIDIQSFAGLLADFAKQTSATLVIRGVRAVSDFEYEFQMAFMNRQLWADLETAFLVPALHLTYLSSSLVREVARLGGDVSEFVHPEVDRALRTRFGR